MRAVRYTPIVISNWGILVNREGNFTSVRLVYLQTGRFVESSNLIEVSVSAERCSVIDEDNIEYHILGAPKSEYCEHNHNIQWDSNTIANHVSSISGLPLFSH